MTFDEVYQDIPGNGWLSEEEARLLWRFAGQFEGPILEVGCYYGRSAVLLARLGRPVYCVDPFSGFDSSDMSGDSIQASFLANLQERDLDNVMTYRTRVEDWVSRPKVGFAYLDGDHTAEGTRAQVRVALECWAEGIAMHDVSNSAEGLPIKLAALEMLGGWDELVGKMAVWRIDK